MYLVFKFPAIVAFIAAIVSGITLPTQYLLWKAYPYLQRKSQKASQLAPENSVLFTDGAGNADLEYVNSQPNEETRQIPQASSTKK